MNLTKTLAALGAVSLLTAACGPQGQAPAELMDESQSTESALYAKALQVSDETGENIIYLEVRSNDEDLLSAYSSDVFTVTPLYEKPANEAAEQAEDAQEQDMGEPEADDAPFVEYEVISSELGQGVMGFRLTENLPEAYRAPFVWRWQYSNDDCFDVTRTSFWHRVWFKAYAQRSSGSSWSSIVSQRKLSNNETYSRCKTSHQIKVGVKARRTSHYSLEFWE